MTLDRLLPLVRHLMQFTGGLLVMRGTLPKDPMLIEAFVGIGLSGVSVAWWMAEDHFKKKQQ